MAHQVGLAVKIETRCNNCRWHDGHGRCIRHAPTADARGYALWPSIGNTGITWCGEWSYSSLKVTEEKQNVILTNAAGVGTQ